MGSVAYLIPTKKKGSSFNSTQEPPGEGAVASKRSMSSGMTQTHILPKGWK